MSDCIFCKIANKEIPSEAVYEDDKIYSFYDLQPQAPVHVLIIPKKHLDSLDDTQPHDAALLAHLLLKVKDIAKDLCIHRRSLCDNHETGQFRSQEIHK